MTSKVFDKFDSLILLLLPKLYMSILAGCDDKISPAKVNGFSIKPNAKINRKVALKSVTNLSDQ